MSWVDVIEKGDSHKRIPTLILFFFESRSERQKNRGSTSQRDILNFIIIQGI